LEIAEARLRFEPPAQAKDSISTVSEEPDGRSELAKEVYSAAID
jgi:hypothetical protein